MCPYQNPDCLGTSITQFLIMVRINVTLKSTELVAEEF